MHGSIELHKTVGTKIVWKMNEIDNDFQFRYGILS